MYSFVACAWLCIRLLLGYLTLVVSIFFSLGIWTLYCISFQIFLFSQLPYRRNTQEPMVEPIVIASTLGEKGAFLTLIWLHASKSSLDAFHFLLAKWAVHWLRRACLVQVNLSTASTVVSPEWCIFWVSFLLCIYIRCVCLGVTATSVSASSGIARTSPERQARACTCKWKPRSRLHADRGRNVDRNF